MSDREVIFLDHREEKFKKSVDHITYETMMFILNKNPEVRELFLDKNILAVDLISKICDDEIIKRFLKNNIKIVLSYWYRIIPLIDDPITPKLLDLVIKTIVSDPSLIECETINDEKCRKYIKFFKNCRDFIKTGEGYDENLSITIENTKINTYLRKIQSSFYKFFDSYFNHLLNEDNSIFDFIEKMGGGKFDSEVLETLSSVGSDSDLENENLENIFE